MYWNHWNQQMHHIFINFKNYIYYYLLRVIFNIHLPSVWLWHHNLTASAPAPRQIKALALLTHTTQLQRWKTRVSIFHPPHFPSSNTIHSCWCSRYASHRHRRPHNEGTELLSSSTHYRICTSVWVHLFLSDSRPTDKHHPARTGPFATFNFSPATNRATSPSSSVSSVWSGLSGVWISSPFFFAIEFSTIDTCTADRGLEKREKVCALVKDIPRVGKCDILPEENRGEDYRVVPGGRLLKDFSFGQFSSSFAGWMCPITVEVRK